jgi:hypothetical protein
LVLNVKLTACDAALHVETGRFPPFIIRQIRILKKIWKLHLEKSNKSLLENVILSLRYYAESDINRTNWTSKVKHSFKKQDLVMFVFSGICKC